MVVPLGTHIADPLERLKSVQAASHSSKEFAEASDARSLSELSQFIPGGLVGIGMRFSSRFARIAPAMVNTTCTNVPGAREPLYFAGAKNVSSFGAGPVVDGMGLINVITSYCDELVLAFTACREMMPDPAFYRECLAESLGRAGGSDGVAALSRLSRSVVAVASAPLAQSSPNSNSSAGLPPAGPGAARVPVGFTNPARVTVRWKFAASSSVSHTASNTLRRFFRVNVGPTNAVARLVVSRSRLARSTASRTILS